MKFGQYLLKNQYSPWQKEYLQYDQLKKVIKRASQPSLLTKEENDHLKELLVIEYDKIDQFIKTQCQYLNQQFVHIKQQQEQEKKNGLSNLETLLYYLYDLSQLIDLSVIGFQKLSKSWQKHGYTIQFDSWQQLKDYFDLLDEWIIDLANLKQEYEHYQLQLNNTCSLSPTSSTSTKHTFSSSSSSITKHYWVHPNHVYELKLLLLFYTDLKEYHDQHTTAFLDDNQWNVYNQLLNHHQNAGFESIEFSEEPFVNNSIKIKHNINTFIPSQDAFKTEYNTITSTKEYLDDITAMTIKTTKNDQEEKNKNLITEEIQLHSKINQYGWQPTLQYEKQRLVYQSTATHSLTFYLDTHIQLKQQDQKKEMNWGLLSIKFMMDDGDDHYKHIKKDDDECIEKEINLPLPNWLQHILHHGFWLHEVPSFSMYVHGVSLLYSESVAFLPWWLQWLEQWDKMEQQQQQPSYENEKESHRVGLSRSTDLQPLLNGNASPWHRHDSPPQTIINFEHDENVFNLLEKKKDEQNEDYLLPPPYLLTATPTATTLLKRKNKNKKKKIKDIKVEPKTFFALERTFLAWLQFCALILTISLNLMNFGRDDPISKNCGGAFILLTVCMAIYALIQYVSRAWQLKFKSPLYRFDDIYGPAVLCILLILAMLVNFGLRITHPLHYNDNTTTTTFLNNTTLNNDL